MFKPVTTSRRQRKTKIYTTERAAARQAAWNRDGGRCVWPTCRQYVALESDDVFRLAHAHEIHGRSVDDPTDVTTMVTVCARCHADLHVRLGGKKKRMDGTTVADLRFYERRVDGWWAEVECHV